MSLSFSLTESLPVIQQYYPYELEDAYTPTYNISIYMPGLVITADEPHVIKKMHFSMVPFFFKDRKSTMCTVRHTQILSKPLFRKLMITHKRCLVLADGFYLWKRFDAEKYPFRFTLKDREVFSMAGIWSAWIDPDTKERYESFCIVTIPGQELTNSIYKSMPVILTPETEKEWLSKTIEEAEVPELCNTYPPELMTRFQVTKDIADRSLNDPSLIKPINNYLPL
ncbi:SOS response-associated peptidase [Pedobacter gandavensis]|uniref:SOS response-associated peptidase n=1 Tax=Pedobacter gandavensis TaxID=2679963 RepID=UPI0029315144|nr:SOS response-associated peptidase [Pedobacter gandavensis]